MSPTRSAGSPDFADGRRHVALDVLLRDVELLRDRVPPPDVVRRTWTPYAPAKRYFLCVMARVGVRELRQNLSVYLRRVQRGETFEVTERGDPVARLVPLEPQSLLDRWISVGKAFPATARLSDLPAPEPAPPGARTTAEVLDEQRAERLP